MRAIAAALCVLAICAGRTDAHGGRVLMQQGFASSSGSPNSVSSSSVSSTTGNDAGTVTSGSVSNNNNVFLSARTRACSRTGTRQKQFRNELEKPLQVNQE
eukprot:jgi/Astpho2/7404/Aster-01991